MFCNGAEGCSDGRCVPGTAPCDGACDETADECNDDCPDADGDGALDSACGGTDCDDANPSRFPGNMEVCDVADLDEDCDPSTFGFRDQDMDGYPDDSCCNGDVCGDDCADTRANQHPTLAESCDSLDNDCDGAIDEGVVPIWYEDGDGDDYGDVDGATMMVCGRPPGFADNPDDCDDTRSSRNPGLGESCTPEPGGGPIDEDCDGTVDEDCLCVAGEDRPCMAPGRCMAGIETCVDGTFGGCSVEPLAETCNGEDDDCDGSTDETLTVECYEDADGDGFPAMGAGVQEVCPVAGRPTHGSCPVGLTDTDSADCDDDRSDTYPGAPELCDRRDNDCSSDGDPEPAEDVDNDGYTAIGFAGCNGGFPKTDCRDGNANVHPGADFQAVPYCTNGNTPCACTGRSGTTWTCPVACRPDMCDGMPATFDFDCDGGTDVMPALSCTTGMTCNMLPGMRCTSNPNPSPMPAQATVRNCGFDVDNASCSCARGSCAATTSGTFALRCR